MGAPHVARRAAVYVSLCSVVVSQPLLQLYGDNLAVFTSARWNGAVIVWFAVVVAFVPAGLMVGIDAALSLVARRHGHVVHAGLVFVGLWGLVSLVLRSVSVGPWAVDALLTAVPAVGLTVAYSRAPLLRSWVSWLAPLGIVVTVVFVAATSALVWTPGAAASDGPSNVSGSPAIDVVWVQLDEAPLFPLVDSGGQINEKRFPGFARLASVSTWYRNVMSVSQRTSVAVPSMLTGREPDYSRQPIAQDHPDSLFALLRGRMALDVTEEVTGLCTGEWCRPDASASAAGPVVVQEPTSFPSFLRDALVVLGHKLLPAGLRARLPAIDESWGGFGRDNESAAAPHAPQPANDEASTETLVGHALRVAKLRTMIERQATGTGPTFRFAHVMLPHRPWVLAPDERKSAPPVLDTRPVTTLDRRRDAYQSFLNQYVALDSEIGWMVDTLKKSPRWSQTMLVVTADHGLTFIPGLSYRDRINRDVPESYEDIYRVPLFVRYPGQVAAATDDCSASVLDLAATVETAAGLTGLPATDGADLRETCTARTSRTVTWIKGSARVSTGVEALLSRVRYYGRWIESDGDVDSIYRSGKAGPLLGTPTPAGAATEPAVTWSLENGDEFGDVGSGRFAHVPTKAVGHVVAGRDMVKGEELLVAVDGVFVGEAPEVAHLKSGERGFFSASLMSRLIGPGSHTVTLWLATPSGGGFELRRLAG